MSTNKKVYTFIDLFAGLGGFHLALKQFAEENNCECNCIFASELKADLRQLYNINYPGTPIAGDITQINPKDIPAHDILCGGFPCQPFSLAGKRQGFNDDKDRGNLFNYICTILKEHKPRYVFLENVANLKGHDNGNTWKVISASLDDLGYDVKSEILSPHQFGIPQHRKRIYIIGGRKDLGGLGNFHFPEPLKENCSVHDIIDINDTNYIPLKKDTRRHIKIWDEFVRLAAENNCKLPGFPIWAMEFGASYEYEKVPPCNQPAKQLKNRTGHLGRVITGKSHAQMMSQLPIYAQEKLEKGKQFPKWKIRYIKENRHFYEVNKTWIDTWLHNIQDLKNSHMKFEWNCGKDASMTLDDKIIQFRASGIRVKQPTVSPALNLVGTQIPIFPWVRVPGSDLPGRYMTVKEAAKIQKMEALRFEGDGIHMSLTRCFEALGNAVNVEVVKRIAVELLK